MIPVLFLLQHGDAPALELSYFWAAVLLALTPVLILGTIGVLVLKKIWKERHGSGEQGAVPDGARQSPLPR
jgi:hypothetical protein